jgi:uncharacterized protein (TIGR00725 family)
MAKTIIGVMGPGGATDKEKSMATELGKQIASNGWTLLTGGRNAGVMHAASQGAHEAGGLTIGILPSSDRKGMSKFVDIPIFTGMGSARNNINILSSDVVVACGTGAGTTSEVMLALKSLKPLILLAPSQKLVELISELDYPQPDVTQTVDHVVQFIRNNV